MMSRVGGGARSSDFVSVMPMRVQRSADQLAQDDEMALATLSVPNRLIAKTQADLGWNFIRGSVDPWSWRQPPPSSAFESQSMVQQGSVNLNFRVLPPPAPGTEGVQSSSGMFLHLPKFAWNALFHMAFVPRGAASPVLGTNGLQIFNTAFSAYFPQSVLLGLTYNSELAIPHSQTGYVPTFTPDIASKFNRARVFSGGMEMFCQTISTANMPYNGRWAATVLNDTTDVAQTSEGLAFPSNQLTQSSRNDKEKKLNEPLYDGAVVVIGDDLREDYVVPNQYADDSISGSWAQLGTFASPLAVGPPLLANTAPSWNGLMAAFITPWDITAQFNGAIFTETYSQIQTDQIGEADGLDIRYILNYTPDTNGNMQFPGITDAANAEALFKITVSHIYAFVANVATGAVGYRTITDQQMAPVSRNDLAGIMEVEINSYAKPYIGLNGMQGPPNVSGPLEPATAVAGKYIGSIVTLASISGQSNPAAVGNGSYCTLTGITHRFMARARQNSSLGHVGPAHIIRYDGIGSDQEITFNAVINTEVVAEADLSQYIKTSDSGAHYPANNNITNVLSSIYRSDLLPEWKCCWKRSEWYDMRKRLQERGCPQFVCDVINKTGAASDVTASSSAAGLFGSLGGLLDTITGASGEYCNSAGGQFGSRAGGQFGSRAGAQFGSGPNRPYNSAGAQFGG